MEIIWSHHDRKWRSVKQSLDSPVRNFLTETTDTYTPTTGGVDLITLKRLMMLLFPSLNND